MIFLLLYDLNISNSPKKLINERDIPMPSRRKALKS